MQTSKSMSQETEEKRGESSSLLTWIEGIKAEFHRISWTGREELLSYTKMVVLATFISGFAVFGVDYLLHKTLALLGLAY